jgi:hypothetical protein
MREVNLALISKLGWKLLYNGDMMWFAQFRGKYLISNSFLSHSPHSYSYGSRKASLSPFLSSLKVPITYFTATPLSPSGTPLGFPLLFIPSPSPHLVQPLPILLVTDLFSFGLTCNTPMK